LGRDKDVTVVALGETPAAIGILGGGEIRESGVDCCCAGIVRGFEGLEGGYGVEGVEVVIHISAGAAFDRIKRREEGIDAVTGKIQNPDSSGNVIHRLRRLSLQPGYPRGV